MANKLPKKADHEPNKYFEGDGTLTETEKLTEQKITAPQEFGEYDLEAICSKFLVNKIYYKMAKKKRREKALTIAANVIVKKGAELQNKLNHNDAEISKKAKPDQNQNKNLAVGIDNNKPAEPMPKPLPEKAGKSDIPKISGGTLSEVIAKITEMLSGKSGSDLKSGANNFAAMIQVLASPEVEKKFDETMKCLAKDSILVADIKDILKDTKAALIFADAINKNFSVDEKAAVSAVSSSDLGLRRQENIISNTANQKLLDDYQRGF